MRYSQIIAEDGTINTDTTIGDKWEERFADHQRQQAKRQKARVKLSSATDRAADQARTAAAARTHNHDRITAAKRDLAGPAG